MEVLTYKKNGGLIWIEVSVTGTPTWYYNYQEDQFHENDNANNRPMKHTIGMPDELVSLTHNWLFRLGNVSNNAISVDVKIEWWQGQGSPIHTWKDTVTVKADSGEETGSSLIRNPI